MKWKDSGKATLLLENGPPHQPASCRFWYQSYLACRNPHPFQLKIWMLQILIQTSLRGLHMSLQLSRKSTRSASGKSMRPPKMQRSLCSVRAGRTKSFLVHAFWLHELAHMKRSINGFKLWKRVLPSRKWMAESCKSLKNLKIFRYFNTVHI